MWSWNDLINPIIYLRDIDSFTLTAGLSLFQGQYVGQVAAADGRRPRQRHPDDRPVHRRPAALRPRDRPDGDQGMSPVAASGLPLYRQIEADLRDRIRSGALRPGRARSRRSRSSMAEYGVSRATVRQALAGLVAEGLLEIRRGLGTYVDRAAVRAHDRRLLLVQPRDRAARAAARDEGPRAADGAGQPTTSPRRSASRPARRSSPSAGSGSPDPTRSSSRRATCRRRGSRGSRRSTSRGSGCTTR